MPMLAQSREVKLGSHRKGVWMPFCMGESEMPVCMGEREKAWHVFVFSLEVQCWAVALARQATVYGTMIL